MSSKNSSTPVESTSGDSVKSSDALARAESGEQALALLLSSPEMMRR